jgi:hypothetical protein
MEAPQRFGGPVGRLLASRIGMVPLEWAGGGGGGGCQKQSACNQDFISLLLTIALSASVGRPRASLANLQLSCSSCHDQARYYNTPEYRQHDCAAGAPNGRAPKPFLASVDAPGAPRHQRLVTF